MDNKITTNETNDKRFGNPNTDTRTYNNDSRGRAQNIDPHAFDFEYSTQFKKEMLYLKERGINPIFIKKTKDYRIPTYKYTKTPALFRAVADFYEQYNAEKTYKKVESVIKKIDEMTQLPDWAKKALTEKDYLPGSEVMKDLPENCETKAFGAV